jgi:hypothetical protein
LGGFLRRVPAGVRSRRYCQAALQRRCECAEPVADAAQRARSRRGPGSVPYFDQDPYIVVGDDGRLSWVMDAFTSSDTYPYSTHNTLDNQPVNYMRNSVKVVVDAYDGTTTFYVFDNEDPILAAYRGIFPSLFKDASAMPAWLRKHVRYPELLLSLQAEVYGLYHMTNPEVFYNREDLWTVATETGMAEWRRTDHAAHAAEFCADETARRDRPGICRDTPLHSGQPQQSDRLDCRAQRRRALRHIGGLRLSQDQAGGRAAADRSAHRSERAAFRAA